MKTLWELKIKTWAIKSTALLNAIVNIAYCYEVVNETEKAIQIHIVRKTVHGNIVDHDWKVWLPKSAVCENY